MVVFDMGKQSTFDRIRSWLKDVRKIKKLKEKTPGNKDQCLYYIIANKNDLPNHKRDILDTEG